MKYAALTAICALLTTPVAAELKVTFEEGAPKDRFTIENAGACPLSEFSLSINLGASSAGLIFDVTGRGAGVEVFQPLDLVVGKDLVLAEPQVRDGDNEITFGVRALAPGAKIAFTIDVDDTVETRGTMVSGAEIQGAEVEATQGTSTFCRSFRARCSGSDRVERLPSLST